MAQGNLTPGLPQNPCVTVSLAVLVIWRAGYGRCNSEGSRATLPESLLPDVLSSQPRSWQAAGPPTPSNQSGRSELKYLAGASGRVHGASASGSCSPRARDAVPILGVAENFA